MLSDKVTTANRGGLPGLRGVEHIALTVPNLKEAVEFFVNVLGCEVVFSMGAFKDSNPEGTWFADNLELHPKAEIPEFLVLNGKNGPHFEIFEFTSPDQKKEMPQFSDYGGIHIAFYVDDMDIAIAYLKSKGVKVLGEKKYGFGPEAGEDSTGIHFKTPWGLLFELISFPHGKAYEKKQTPMWKPAELTE